MIAGAVEKSEDGGATWKLKYPAIGRANHRGLGAERENLLAGGGERDDSAHDERCALENDQVRRRKRILCAWKRPMR